MATNAPAETEPPSVRVSSSVSEKDGKLSKTSSATDIGSPTSEKVKDDTLVDEEPTPFRWTNWILRRPIQKYDPGRYFDEEVLSMMTLPLLNTTGPRRSTRTIHRFDPDARWTYREERKLVRKIDWKVMLWAAVSFSALNLDRGNLSQANTDNFLPDLKMTTNDYNLGNTIFRLAFFICGAPFATCFEKARPLIFLQGGFIPDLILYMSYFYTKNELPIRLSLFWMSLNVCTILASFIAFGVLRMRGILGRAGWRWLFLVEGCLTLIIGIATFFKMPPSPTQTKTWFRPKGWFTDREEVIARLLLGLLWKAILDYDLWPLYIIGLLFGIPATPPAQYLTLSLRNMGFNTFQTNLLTIPAAVGTIITMYAIAVVSETVNDRAFVSMAEDVWCLPFLIALRALPDQPNPWIFYALATGLLIFPSTHPIQVGWCSRNAGGVASRTVNASLYNMFVQASGIISSNIYRKDDAPMWNRRGNSWLLGVCAFNCLILYPGVKAYYVWRNKQKAIVWDEMTNEEKADYLKNTRDSGHQRLDFRFAH
ncbi:MFS general substrate transporter [Coprinellus micaceus]|uniref:MFS general substrate transporter n=1 Tax=Coprinellus micaceus TaxID=71717 RepID=A0A4Y7RYZ8_COPMI|nr:MFS general substrate transporter [Coprinellus micaceus]